MSPEPFADVPRPTRMKRHFSVLIALPCVALLAACGQQADSGPSPSSAKVGDCAGGSSKVTAAKQVATVDLDGDGTAEQVSLTADDATGCASYLVAKVAGAASGVALTTGGEAGGESTYSAVTVPGRKGQLLVVRTSHPRGGSQDAIYGYAGSTFGAVKGADGKPLQLPFVATDTSPATDYVSVSCTDNGFVVQEAVPHQPAGVAAAFDVMETTYTLDGLTATAGTAKKVGDNVLPAKLPTSYPALSKNASFTDGCSA